MTAVGFITVISMLSRLLCLFQKCIIIIYILCIDCAENNKSCLTQTSLQIFTALDLPTLAVKSSIPAHVQTHCQLSKRYLSVL